MSSRKYIGRGINLSFRSSTQDGTFRPPDPNGTERKAYPFRSLPTSSRQIPPEPTRNITGNRKQYSRPEKVGPGYHKIQAKPTDSFPTDPIITMSTA